jgi:hypothetical protein
MTCSIFPSHNGEMMRPVFTTMKTLHVASVEPRQISQELLAVLCTENWTEFKPLFEKAYVNMREHHAAHGSNETLRLTTYEVLQRLVSSGCVEKDGKRYRAKKGAAHPSNNDPVTEHCLELLKAVQNIELVN